MEDSLKVYWQITFEKVTNREMLRYLYNPLREYEDELIEGAIVDVGCGQSPILMDFAASNRELIAIDNEEFQLSYLKKRVENEGLNMSNWKFLNQSFPQDGLPDIKFSLMIFSNVLHFYSLDECVEIGDLISNKSSHGTLIYVVVHSSTYYKNNPGDPGNHDYFKHYFTSDDLNKVFPAKLFDRLYFADIEKESSKFEMAIQEEWLDRLIKSQGIKKRREIAEIKRESLKDTRNSDLHLILRRR
jgi:SAM-dependent methyltransferase